jgi:hypothetical protein
VYSGDACVLTRIGDAGALQKIKKVGTTQPAATKGFMHSILRRWQGVLAGVVWWVASLCGHASEPSPSATDSETKTLAQETSRRWPERKRLEGDGIRVEFSAGQEALAEAVLAEAQRWNKDAGKRFAEAASIPPIPLGALDARQRRDLYLREIAREVGLSEPSTLMKRCYDTMLAHYETMAGLFASTAEAGEHLAKLKSFAIWNRGEVINRLEAGEKIPGMSWDPVKQEGSFNVNYNFELPPTEAEKKLKEEAENSRLNHAFNYSVKDGIAHISATFTIGEKDRANKHGDYVQPPNFNASRSERLREFLRDMPEQTWPLLLKDDSPPSPGTLIQQQRELGEWILETANPRKYRDANLVLVLLHETIEVAIVEHYIGSADRRWLCDGAANFLSRKIALRHAGPEFATQVYDLEAQLHRHARHQPSVRLKKWPAVENEKKQPHSPELSEAHYPFATRAITLMAAKHGDDILAKLFSEIGKTPRQKVRYKTVEAAYKQITGDNLDAVLTAAEKNPIPHPAQSGPGGLVARFSHPDRHPRKSCPGFDVSLVCRPSIRRACLPARPDIPHQGLAC